ncbi:MAG: RAD55 family ATPase [Candidatus Hodarchaeales archaeon]
MEIVKTGLKGLDELLGGGIPKGWTIILSGEPGAGKTCLSIGFLIEGIRKYDEAGIFLSFNESRKELVMTQKSFGYDLEAYEKEGRLRLLDFSYGKALGRGQLALQQAKLDLPALTKEIKFAINEIDAKRLVIDPLTIISLLFDDIREIRYNLLRFFDVIRRFGVTSLAISESIRLNRYTIEDFLASGVIRLYNERTGAKRQRGIEIIKMRGVKHKRGVFPFTISEKGVIVSPDVELPS